MQPALANLVHSIFTHTLRLKERVEEGEKLSLEAEQNTLRRMLLTETEAQRWIEYGGDGAASAGAVLANDLSGNGAPRFLGVRYALACWIDELFILDSPWDAAWNERKLEVDLYASNDRAWKFWEQARLTEKRPTVDALEAFFLCVMLGFRGELRDEPGQLQAWVAGARGRVLKESQQDWKPPPHLEPPTHVPPLRGHEALQRMVAAAGVLLLLLLPIVTFLIVYQATE